MLFKRNQKILECILNHLLNSNQGAEIMDNIIELEQLKNAAIENTRAGRFSKALEQWSTIRKNSPNLEQGYAEPIYIYIKLNDLAHAEALCKEGMEKCSFPSMTLLVCYSDIKVHQKKFFEALNILAEVRKYFPKYDVGYRNSAFIYANLSQYDLADRMCKEGLQKCSYTMRLYQQYIYFTFFLKLNDEERLKELLERRMLLCNAFPNNFIEIINLANTCYKLSKYNPAYSYAYNCIASSIFKMYNGDKNINVKHMNNTVTEKIAFFSVTIQKLKYYIPCIKYILPYFMDIVIELKNKHDHDFIKEFGIGSYNIIYGKQNVKNYYIIVTDGLIFHLSNMYDNLSDNIIISLPHGMDCNARLNTLKKSHLCILELNHEDSSNTVLNKNSLNLKNLDLYDKLCIHAKCEITHTGPYHIDDFLKNSIDHNTYKTIFLQKFNYHFDDEKPLCVLFEDEISHFGQIIYCLNKLSEIANVIIKPYFNSSSRFLNKLNKKIIIYSDKSHAPNLLRYAADFIFAGYFSGTLCSSVALGLNVIPYYSRIVSNKFKENKRYHYTYFKNKNITDDIIKYNLLQKLKIFDLLDTKSIQEAILQPEYLEWYRKILPSIQKEILGDYMLEGAAEKTAEYIMRFAREGTLGKDCSAVYLKEQYFKQS